METTEEAHTQPAGTVRKQEDAARTEAGDVRERAQVGFWMSARVLGYN